MTSVTMEDTGPCGNIVRMLRESRGSGKVARRRWPSLDHNGVDKRSQGEAGRDRALRSRSRSDGGKAGDAVKETCPEGLTGRRSGQLGAQGKQCFK